MHKIDIKGKVLEIYDSIDELPITRHHLFNRYLLIDSGVGSDLQDFDNHLLTMMKYIEAGDKEKATKEAMNLRQNVAFIQSEQSPKLNAFVALIKSINGDPLTDLSEGNIQAILTDLGNEGVKASTVSRWVDETKKKLKASLKYFSQNQAKAQG
jgi:hypothetical protein